MNRVDIAYFHFKYKLEKLSSRYNDLGFMSIEDISRIFLKKKYPLEDVKLATDYLINDEMIDLYYEITCGHCGTSSFFFERNDGSRSVALSLQRDGEACQGCGRGVVLDVNNIQRRYTISHRLFHKQGAFAEPTEDIVRVNPLRSFFKWLKRKKK